LCVFSCAASISDIIYLPVHKVSPPGIKTGEDAENSLNTELGFRFDKGALHGEVIGITTILESARF
jgi:hypothetical protein